jgi:lipoprotein-anchoring transpeptidase ErfK/SrfK
VWASAIWLAMAAVATPSTVPAATVGKNGVAATLDIGSFNDAVDTPILRPGAQGPAVVRAQVLLDRAWFSSGEIDGRFASNMERIVKAYQQARGLRPTGTVTPETWQALREADTEVLTRYTITREDAAGPFQKLPSDPQARRKLKSMPYESLEEALAERFHTSPAYLRQINRGVRIEGGGEIIVPKVTNGSPPQKAASIEIDKSARVLYVLDAQKLPLAAFPISIGNERRDPLPLGFLSIKNEVKNPTFTYDPVLLKNQPKDAQKMELPPGPNNPIGTVWIGLSKPHWGIHGTAVPSNVGHSETNGCIHLTNWDAERVSMLAKPGFKVVVRP